MKIPTYERQVDPSGIIQSGSAPVSQVGNAMVGNAMVGIGQQLQNTSNVMQERRVREGELNANKKIAELEVEYTQELQRRSTDQDPDIDPAGMAEAHKKYMTERQQAVMGETEDGYTRKSLQSRFVGLQRNNMMKAVSVEYQANADFYYKRANDTADNYVTAGVINPLSATNYLADIKNSIDATPGITAKHKRELTENKQREMSIGAMGRMIESSPDNALLILKDEKNPLTRAMNGADVARLLEEAGNEETRQNAVGLGEMIGKEAGSLSTIQSRLDQINDKDLKSAATTIAYQTYGRKETARREGETKQIESFNESLFGSDNPGIIPDKPEGMKSLDYMRALNSYNATKKAGISDYRKTEKARSRFIEVYDLVSRADNREELAKTNVWDYRKDLTDSEFNWLIKSKQDVLNGGTKLSDYKAQLDNVWLEIESKQGRLKTSDKRDKADFYSTVSNAIFAREQHEERQLEPGEVTGIVNDYWKSQTTRKKSFIGIGWTSNKSFRESVPDDDARIISGMFASAKLEFTAKDLVAFYQGIDSDENKIERAMELYNQDPANKALPPLDIDSIEDRAAMYMQILYGMKQ